MSTLTIDPVRITNFDRTDAELEAFALFAVLVAGKNSTTTAALVGRLIASLRLDPGVGPLTALRGLAVDGSPALHNFLVAHRVGQYGRIEACLGRLHWLNLRTCTLEELLAVPGIGPKTARFFLLHSRRDVDVAVLDVHVLRWLREVCGCEELVPKGMQTPQNPDTYRALERLYIYMRKAQYPGMAPADADLLIWTQMSGRLS